MLGKYGINTDDYRRPAVKAAVPSRRRVLGDITNSHAEETKDNRVTKYAAALPDVTDTRMHVDEPVVPNFAGRPYMLRPADDIDAKDGDNPLLVSSYANEMYDHFREVEREFRVHPNYMTRQEVINEKMRTILVDWLVEVHLKFKMALETLFITVSILDRYLQCKQVRRSKLQLVGVSALLVASKYEEIYPPELKELVFITDKAYNEKEILDMEGDIIKTLDYKFCVPTAHTFLCRYLKAAHAERVMVQLCCYLVERSLQEYSMLKYPPSLVAAASILIARVTMKRHRWSPTLLRYSQYDEADLMACVEDIRTNMNVANNPQNAVYRKYSSTKFGGVAKMPLSYN